MTIYYVNSNGGSDGNNGTSVGTPWATIQKGANTAVAGDTVYVLAGVGYGGGTGGSVVVQISTSGSAGSPIIFSGFDGVGPTTYPGAPRPVVTTARAFQVFQIQASYITVQGFDVSGLGNGCTVAGAWNQVFVNTSIAQYEGVGIGAHGSGTPFHDIQILSNVCHDLPGNGVEVTICDFVTVSGNVCYNNGNFATVADSGISVGPTKDFSGSGTKIFVTGNVCYNNTNLVANRFAGRGTSTASGTSASGQTTLNVASSTAFVVGSFVFDPTTPAAIASGTYITAKPTGTTLTLSQNIVSTVQNGDNIAAAQYTDGEGIIIDSNIDQSYLGRTLVQNNLCFNNGSGGIYVTRSSHCDVNFNTCWQNQQGFQRNLGGVVFGAQGLYCSSSSVDNTVFNNIVVSPSWGPVIKDDGTSDTFSTNLGNGGDGSGIPGTGNFTSNPLLVSPGTVFGANNFSLAAGSPALNAASATKTRTSDINGATRGLANLGAFGTRIAGVCVGGHR